MWRGITVYRSWLYTTDSRRFMPTIVNHLTFAASSLVNGVVRVPRPDVLIASGPPYFSQFAGALVALSQGVPLIVETRDLWPDYLAEMGIIRSRRLLGLMFASERWLLRRAAAVVVVTDSFGARMIDKGVASHAINVIPNGVDLGRYYAAAEAAPIPPLARRGESDQIIGYLGTFGAGQGLDAVIDAARIMRRRGSRARFVLVGDGPQRSALEANLLADPVDGVSLHPPIDRDATRAFYNACDVVIVPHASLPVLGATVPSKIFEVMACERPLVAAVRGEGAAIIQRSHGGVLATPGDASSIADATLNVLAMQPEQRAAMGAAGREFVKHHFNREILAARYLEVLERIRATDPGTLRRPLEAHSAGSLDG
jgi:glycosyltransferase involved in cell wall biosynthesis